MWVLVAGFFLVAPARASSGSPTLDVTATPSSLVSLVEDSATAVSADPQEVLEKIAPGLHAAAESPSKSGLANVIIHTVDMPALSGFLATAGATRVVEVDGELRSTPYVARPWGAVGRITSIFVQIPERALMDVAALGYVLYVDEPSLAATTFPQDAAYLEEQRALQSYIERVRSDVKATGPQVRGTSGPGISPTSWAVVREHKAWDAWQIAPACCMGDGVNVAVVDTGEDFGHPSMQGAWATAPSGAWAGWPIMFHPASMEGLFGQGWWTAGSDLDRLPLPYWLSANDGDSWYSNTDYTANDTDLDGFLLYQSFTINPETGLTQTTPRANPQQYGNWGPNYNTRIDRNYYVGCAGLPGACILSASGYYRLGVNRDDTLTGLYGEKVGLLVVDSTISGVYDTVYVDLNFNFDFTDDKALTVADPIAVADLTGDGVSDVSGGLLYFIAQSTGVTDEVIIAGASGSETGATLLPKWDLDGDGTTESAGAAVDIDGWFNFKPATELFLRSPALTRYYFPGATEDLYEEYTSPVGRNEGTGFTWRIDGADTSFGPIQLMTGRSVPTNALLNGPAGDFGVSLVYDIEVCDPSFATCNAYTGYSLNPDTGDILLQADVPDNYVVFIVYQLGTYTLEPVSGAITFQDPVTGFPETIPAGWDLLASYESGLPIPYSQVYGPSHGYETFIPGNGDLVTFHGDFDQQTHGSFVSSTVAASPFGNIADPDFEAFGTAPNAHIIGIAACCNVPGPVGLFGAIEDQREFAALGYDGRAATGDEAVIMSNSFGSTSPLNTGWTWEDRWLIDFWYRYPQLTTLIALGNNGPGYGTSAPGGSSPGVIGVGAGTSMDYRVRGFGDTGDAAWEFPDCTLAGSPPDPRLCTGYGSPFGPGPYGDIVGFSSRGPTLMGTPKPDIVSVGAFGVEAAPLNTYCFGDPLFCDGNFAWDLFSGTSQATPVTAGVTALIVQAYRVAHAGANPTNNLVKELLKSGADDMHRDILQQGAGWTNALRSVRSALDTAAWIGTADGVTSNTDHWVPGNYLGSRPIGFTKLMTPGTSDSTTLTLTNRNQGVAKTVQISDAVYQRVARYTYSFTWNTGAGIAQILRPTNPAGAAGLYASDGTTLLQAMPFDTYWTTSDFVKTTYTYDNAAFTGAVNMRLDTFNWYDDNTDNAYGGAGERNRMSVSTPGGGANSVWETARLCCNNILTGWVQNPRAGAAAPIPGATLIVEFYEKANWGWVRVWNDLGAEIPFGGNLLIPGANGQEAITLTVDVPAGTPAGMYEGAVYVRDGANTLTIPIVINVPIASFPVRLGGNVPATSLYENSGIIQGSRSTAPWQQTGDNRYIYATVNVVNAVGRTVIYQSILQGARSDSEMYVYSLKPDTAWTDTAVYGPGTMTLDRRTVGLIDSTKSNFLNKELMFHAPPLSGFIAMVVKAWNSGGGGETDPLDASIGIMEVFPITAPIVTNRVVGSVPISVWANVPLFNGIDTAAAQLDSQTTAIGGPYLQDNPNDPYTSSWTLLVTLPAGLLTYRCDVVGVPTDDIDFYLMRDNGDGIFNPADPIVRASGTPFNVEGWSYDNPVAGNYWLAVHGWGIPSGSGAFTGSCSQDRIIILASNFSDINAPVVTVPPNTPSGFGLEWRFPGDLAPGTQSSFLYVSPAYASFALVQLLTISFTYNLAPPTINRALDLSPVPNAVINDPIAAVVANVADSNGVDRFSAQLFIDGVDVTDSIKVLAPFPYSPVTVAWEHTEAPFSDGRHSAVLNIRDRAGNLKTEIWSWTVDTTGPNLAIISPSSDALTSAPTWSFEAMTDPGATVTLTVSGVAVTPTVTPEGRITATLSFASDGTYDIVVTAADSLGNEATATRTVMRDATAPVISASADVLSPTNVGSTRVSGSVDEDVSQVWVNGIAAPVAADGTFSVIVPLSEGSNAMVVTTTDQAGNTRTVTLPSITRDTVAPTITVNPLPAVISDVDTTTITVSGTVPGADVFFVTVNGRTVTLTAGAFDEDFDLAVGDNVFVVLAQDNAGNVAQSVVSVAYSPVVTRQVNNYNSIIASGVAVVLLIVGFVVGYLLSGRGGGPTPLAGAVRRDEAIAEEELPRQEPAKTEEEEL